MEFKLDKEQHCLIICLASDMQQTHISGVSTCITEMQVEQ